MLTTTKESVCPDDLTEVDNIDHMVCSYNDLSVAWLAVKGFMT